jgi:uncharacterized protein YPO0396
MVGGAVEAVVPGAAAQDSPGTVAGRIAGALVGAVIAFTSKARAIGKMAQAQRINALDDLFEQWETDQRSFLDDAIRGIVDAGATGAEADLRSRIAQRQAEFKAAASEVAAAMQAVGRDSAAAAAELSARREVLEDIQRTVAALAGELRTRLEPEER